MPCITPKAALIDMDGVLYDSMKNHVEAWYRTLTPMGFKCSKDEFYLYEGRTGASTIKYLFDKHFGKQVSDDECAEIYKIKEKHFNALEKIVPMPAGRSGHSSDCRRTGRSTGSGSVRLVAGRSAHADSECLALPAHLAEDIGRHDCCHTHHTAVGPVDPPDSAGSAGSGWAGPSGHSTGPRSDYSS